MSIFKLIMISSFLFFIGCSASYEELRNKNFKPADDLSGFLYQAYKEKANFEAIKMHDWNSAKLYSEKAISSISGNKILPQKIEYWNILPEKRIELVKGYNSLMTVYDNAKILDPYNLARAISSLDCWSEQQEENWQTWDINQCRDDFLQSIHNIYKKIDQSSNKNSELQSTEYESKSDSASLVTEDKDKNILQIIYFDFDKSNLTSVSINEIKSFIKLNREKIKKFIIIGHTDTMGSKKYNQELSLERANVVKNILVESGIDKMNIKILGKGEEDLAYKTKDDIRNPVNRRAEISPLN